MWACYDQVTIQHRTMFQILYTLASSSPGKSETWKWPANLRDTTLHKRETHFSAERKSDTLAQFIQRSQVVLQELISSNAKAFTQNLEPTFEVYSPSLNSQAED
jgi:hypothetical protein